MIAISSFRLSKCYVYLHFLFLLFQCTGLNFGLYILFFSLLSLTFSLCSTFYNFTILSYNVYLGYPGSAGLFPIWITYSEDPPHLFISSSVSLTTRCDNKDN